MSDATVPDDQARSSPSGEAVPGAEWPSRSPGTSVLQAVAVWLFCIAVLGGLLGTFLVYLARNPLFGGEPDDAEAWQATMLLAALVSLPALASVVTWRAASPERVLAARAALGIAVTALVVLFAPFAAALLPQQGGFYGITVYRLAEAARLPWSLAVTVPATLVVLVVAARWRVEVPEAVRRRTVVIAAVLGTAGIALGGLVAVNVMGPACPSGRVCVPAAGFSFVLPAGWSASPTEAGELAAYRAGNDSTRLAVSDGAAVLRRQGRTIAADFALARRTIPDAIEHGAALLSANVDVAAREEVLPIGRAIRVGYRWVVLFVAGGDAHITYWIPVGDGMVLLDWERAYGAALEPSTDADPRDLAELLGSLQPL
jgi:hypothetical protein